MYPADTDWKPILRTLCPKGRADIISGLADALPEIEAAYGVDTPLRLAHFLAQVAHESGGFRYVREIWGPTPAQTRYEGRKDLGNVKKGDGLKFLGRSLIQYTGRSNYEKLGAALGVDLVAEPQLLEAFPYAALAAGVFWRDHKLNAFADADDCKSCTKTINGGLNGFAERQVYLARAKVALGIHEDDAVICKAQEEIMPPARIKEMQTRLDELGYHCVPDGQIGTQTVGALASFQHDNALAITSKFDAATEQALYDAEKRAVPASRASGLPDSSRILQGASALQKGAAGVAGTIAVKAAADPVAALAGVNGYFDQLKAALAPFGMASDFISQHWMVFAAVLAVAVFAYARQIEKARIEDHQSGKTP